MKSKGRPSRRRGHDRIKELRVTSGYKRRQVVGWAAVIVIILAVIDVILVVGTAMLTRVSLRDGMLEILNDPGKHIFSFVVVPIAIYIYFRRFPWKQILKTSTIKSVFILAVLTVLALVVAVMTFRQYSPVAQSSNQLLPSAADC